MLAGDAQDEPPLLGREPAPHAEAGEDEQHDQSASQKHDAILAQSRGSACASWRKMRIPAGLSPKARGIHPLDSGVARAMSNLDDFAAVDTSSLFSEAIREHLELKARNSALDGEMPLDRYLDGDLLENHPLFKSEEQARIEETLDGEPAAELSSERLPWPGEETVENASAEGPALDEALWTGRPRDFDWGD
jgi:hypothetical protein